MEEEGLNLILDNMVLSPVTPNTVIDKAQLLEDIKKIRLQGYAMSSGEFSVGMGIAVPISNYAVPVVLSIAGPQERMVSNSQNYIKELKRSAKEISRNLLRYSETPAKKTTA
jgi:IclR family transcriptional regulator, KDG regulon repressor